MPRILLASCFAVAALALSGASAHPSAVRALDFASAEIETSAASSARAFRRCMRRTYGPRHFARVSRAHRFFMAQACGA